MSWALITLVAGKVEALLAGKTYPKKGSATPIAMPVHKGSLPVKDKTSVEDEAIPFILIKPGAFAFARPQNSLAVTLVGAQYTSGTIAAGLQAQDALLAALEPLKDQIFTGYKLMLPITGQVGEPDSQINPHPYYHFTLELQFRKSI